MRHFDRTRLLHLPHLLPPYKHHLLPHLLHPRLRIRLPLGRLLEPGSRVRECGKHNGRQESRATCFCELLLSSSFHLFSFSFLIFQADHPALLQAGGAFTFVTSMAGWWIFFAIMLASLDFPFSVPVGDLSHIIRGASEKQKVKNAV